MLFLFILGYLYTPATSAFINTGTFLQPINNYKEFSNDIHGALNKRAYIQKGSQCSSSEASEIRGALESCAVLAQHAFHAVKSDEELFEFIFKTDSTDIQDLVEQNFKKLYEECSRKEDEVYITCEDETGKCKENQGYKNVLGYARIAKEQIVICPNFFNQPESSSEITATNQDTTIMHELAHIILDLPEDFGYEWTGVHNLRGHLRPDETRRGTRRLCLEPPSSSDRETEKNADGIDYPESGLKAWLVVLGSWCAMMAGLGIVNSTGIFEAYVSNTVLSSSSTNALLLVLSILSGIGNSFLFTPAMSAIFQILNGSTSAVELRVESPSTDTQGRLVPECASHWLRSVRPMPPEHHALSRPPAYQEARNPRESLQRFAPSLDIKDGTSAMLVTMLGVLFVEWAYLVPITHVPSYYLVCQDLHGAENAANGEVARSAGSTP
ncbi:hypothetical protein MCOR03_010705 [Pyricularia oryzae]|uniref:Lysine-specific metallo-endopeptidase domain-containing protein n=1 Tax=Pyricularia oryzae TaxID=318829 RepID=A0A4P7NU60_PYROR|nr:hypothetical protein MCOR26_004037 [Pyricularia oryzae]KAI6344172.1 hypothetical protein MCOR28_004410 [Pyricularia oryzae]KAI6412058.1 hypothetical protein MCOR20_003872 [Pyricularia oryzae]KAI6437074.1 hypothetical protein MCOR21_000810 [Pyricularia oryzae]KAI6548353.1 hypothetical protein MCOR03_010705 [Pyricularia oryzae]